VYRLKSLNRLSSSLREIIAPLGVLVAIASPSLADLPPIERLVPREAVLVVSAPDVAASWTRMDATPIGAFIRSDDVQELLREFLDDEQLQEAVREAGFESAEELLPHGGVGLALFLEMDEELGMKRPAYLFAADYGDRAEAMARALRKRLDEMVAELNIRVDERDLRGRTVAIVEFPAQEAADDDFDDFDDFGGFDPFGGFDMDPSILFEGMRTLHFVRDSERLFFSSSLLAIEDALGVVDGDPIRSSLADNPEFTDALAQLGGAHDGFAAFFTAPLQQMLGPIAGMQLAMAQPFVAQLFGDIRVHSFGVKIDDDESMITTTVGTLTPRGRAGLLTLIDGSAPRGPLPGFVGPDAIGYGTISVRFDRLMPLVNGIVRGLPPMVGDMAMPMLDQFGPALEQAFGGLGPEVHSVGFAPANVGEAAQTVVAIRCTRIEAVNAMVAMFGPGIGMMPRDFLGQTIYSSDEAPVALGLGGGWMVVGTNEGVERVMRTVGQADLPTLENEPAFRQVVAAIPGRELLGWGFNDTIGAARAQQGAITEAVRMLAMEGDFDDARLLQVVERLTDPDMMKEYFGPQSWTFEAVDNGLVFRSMVMRPTRVD